MARKNFDDFVSESEKLRKPTPEEAARMVALIHGEPEKPAAWKTTPRITQTRTPAPPPPQKEPNRRGRKAIARNETERLYRLSVDLPGSLLLKLKGAAMANDVDMKTYVRTMLEKHLA
jgi:hypothetical protein